MGAHVQMLLRALGQCGFVALLKLHLGSGGGDGDHGHGCVLPGHHRRCCQGRKGEGVLLRMTIEDAEEGDGARAPLEMYLQRCKDPESIADIS